MVYLLLFIISLFFFLIQLDLSKYFVFTDANLYLYYADQLSKGAILYKDLYMTNFPLVPYISVVYKYLMFGSLHGFYMTACIEALLSATILFLCLKKIYNNKLIGLMGFLFYLSTFLVFSSANHQNGILLAVLMFTSAYLCFLYKKYILTGIFLGLALCAKAYMLPIIVAFFVYVFIIEKKNALSLAIGMIGTIIIIMLPTFIFAYKDFINQVFGYSLSRSAGYDKGNIIGSFITFDPVVVGLLLYSLTRWNQQKFPVLATGFSIFFLLYYQDLYLLYFTMFVPIAVLALGDLLVTIEKHTKHLSVVIGLVTIMIIINVFNVNRYINSIQGLMAIPNIDEFVSIVQKTKPEYLYGEYGIVQGISYLSGIPMLEGVSDTNRKMFLSGVLDKNTMTTKIKQTKTTIIAYSYNNNLDIATTSATFNWRDLKNQCKIIHSQDFTMGYPVNTINIIKCF